MLQTLAFAIIVLAALFQIGLAAASFFAPNYAARFLSGFASTARLHILEMLIRITVGGAFVVYAPSMLWSNAFLLFGWVLIVTSIILLLLPWRWHSRFGQPLVLPIIRHVWIFGIFSLPLGGLILFAVFYRGLQ